MVRDRQTSIKSFLTRHDGSQGDPIQLDASPRRPRPRPTGSSPKTPTQSRRRGSKRDHTPPAGTDGEGLDDIHLEATKTQLVVDDARAALTLEQRRRAGRILDSSDGETSESSDGDSSHPDSVVDLLSDAEHDALPAKEKLDKGTQKSLARNALVEARERRRSRQDGSREPETDSDSSDPLNLGASSRRRRRQSLQDQAGAKAGPGPNTRLTRARAQAQASSPQIDWSQPPVPQTAPAKRGRRAATSSDDSDTHVDKNARRGPGVRAEETPKRRRIRDPDDPSSEEERVNPDELLSEIELDAPVLTESRLRSRDKKSDFQRNLELLKRKKLLKSGQAADTASESSISVVDVDSDSHVGSEDFIVDEDEEEASPGHLLPAAFRMTSHQDLEYSFKLISQYFTHLVVDGPAFVSEKNSTYFRPAFHALARKIQSQKDSSVTSSVWPNEFKHSLEKYPELVISFLDDAVPGCDACRISGRMSKYEGNLRGEPYDPETFETIENSESDSDEDEQTDRGPFKLGKYCRARAEVFSGFAHWEYELYMAYYNSYHSLLREMNLEADSSDDDEAPIINLESDEDEMWVQPIRQKQAAKRKKKPAGPARKVHGFTESKVGDADEVLENYFEKKGLVKERWRALESLIERAQQLEVNAAGATRYDD